MSRTMFGEAIRFEIEAFEARRRVEMPWLG